MAGSAEIAGVVTALVADIEQIAAIDRNLVADVYGLPEEWPIELLSIGTPVWVVVQGKPLFGVQPGVIDFVGGYPSHDAKDRRTIGILVPERMGLQDNIFYTLLNAFVFWPRSIDVDVQASVTFPSACTTL